MLRAFKYRLWTNQNQHRELGIAAETHRRIYNACLEYNHLAYDCWGVSLNYIDYSRWFTAQKAINRYFACVNRSSVTATLKRVDASMAKFFKGKGKVGLPRPRARGNTDCISFPAYGDGVKVVANKLRLQHIGSIRVRWHRPLPEGKKIRCVRIIRDNDKWFVCFTVDMGDTAARSSEAAVGVDLGLKSFVTTSDGEMLGDTRCLERALPEFRRRQRALARCKRGSNRRKRVKAGVSALHEKVRNVRRDLHFKVARSLVDRYGIIAAESLNIEWMLKNRRFARRISDASWYSFTQRLISTAEIAGCQVALVDPKNTSQQCSRCGEIVRKSLAVRVHKCECGCVLDRDVNAAINILGRAVPKDAKAGLLALS